MTFPGAAAPRADAEYTVLGAPLDASTSFQPGTRFGPRRIRTFAEPFEDYDHHTDRQFTDLSVHDHGDVEPGADTPEYLEYLRGTIADLAAAGTVPLVLGGEHTVTVAAVRALDPEIFVCLDAHLDLRASFRGDPFSHATVTHHALDVVEEAIVIGARAGSKAEWERARETDVTVVPPGDVPAWEPDVAGRRAYLSVDVDAADPGVAPGTGTREPFGLDSAELRDVVRAVAPDAVGFDVVEVNDRDDGQAPALAGKLLREFVFAHGAVD